MPPRTLLLVALSALAAPAARPAAQEAPPATPAAAVDLTLLADLKARGIGPAVCSGRIGAVAGVPGDPRVVWAGGASGGVWKSSDGGLTFEPVFDDQDCCSVGAIAIDPRSPDVVWVGTGEGNPRNSASVGRGVYLTRDGGREWTHLGLERTEKIHRIVIDPSDPDTVFVAALGTSWGESEERGLYRTRDGGRTWQKVLHVDDATGCCDVVMDPRNPDKLFAAMWQHRRWPWAFRSGGPGSGIWRSLDGGDTWTRLTDEDGLPKGELGKSCLQIAASDPRVVYALVEAKKSVLLRSDDGGFSFRTVNDDGVAPRPFYFCDIRVDPHDSNRLYNMHTVIDVSTDGGRTFQGLVGWGSAHPDHHAMWIDPLDPDRVLIGNDGGVYVSQDRGQAWRFCQNLPLAQFYHVAVDDAEPFHVYGGLQDNGSWRGPSSVWENGGIRNLHWQEVCFGDGFATLPMPDDDRRGYAMSQGGALVRWDLRTGSRKSIRPPAPADDVELRFNWNAAIAQDPFDPATIYYGSQLVHRSADRGDSWTAISPDLTTDNPEWQKQDESGGLSRDVTGAENFCTIMTIAPSPVQQGVLWAGTDDGRVHVSQDGGESWRSVEDRIPGLPANTWCPHIEAGKHDAATAFAVFDGHRSFDWTPYVYVTRDYGETWTSLATDAIDGYCLVLEQDPRQERLLWLGTEFGLYVSFDGGAQWQRWKHGVPACSAMAITTHPRTGDLVVATHGRSIFVLDELTPLRPLATRPELLTGKLELFPIAPAIAWESAQTPSTRFPGSNEFRGETRPRGAFVDVIVNADELDHPDEEQQKLRAAAKKEEQAQRKEGEQKEGEQKEGEQKEGEAKDEEAEKEAEAAKEDEEPKDQVTIEIKDAEGDVIRTFRHKVHLGLNRIVWRLERDGRPGPARELQEDPELPPPGREVLPGDYSLTVRFQGESRTTPVRVLPDPRVAIPMADRLAKDALRVRAEELRAELRPTTQRLARSKRDLDFVERRLGLEPKVEKGADDPQQALRDALKKAKKAYDELAERIWGERDVQGIASRDKALMSRFMSALRVSGTDDAPTATELLEVERARARMQAIVDAVDGFEQGAMAELRTALGASGLGLLPAGK